MRLTWNLRDTGPSNCMRPRRIPGNSGCRRSNLNRYPSVLATTPNSGGKKKGCGKLPNAQSGNANKVIAEKLFILFICRLKDQRTIVNERRESLKVLDVWGGGDGVTMYVVKRARGDGFDVAGNWPFMLWARTVFVRVISRKHICGMCVP